MSQTWQVRISVMTARDVPEPDHATTTAHAVLALTPARRITGTGRAHLHPGDVDIPEIGEDIAVARALGELSDRLVADALERLSPRRPDPGAW